MLERNTKLLNLPIRNRLIFQQFYGVQLETSYYLNNQMEYNQKLVYLPTIPWSTIRNWFIFRQFHGVRLEPVYLPTIPQSTIRNRFIIRQSHGVQLETGLSSDNPMEYNQKPVYHPTIPWSTIRNRFIFRQSHGTQLEAGLSSDNPMEYNFDLFRSFKMSCSFTFLPE